MSFADQPLSRPPDPSTSTRPASSTSRWIIVGACAVIAAAGLTLWWMSHAQPPPVLPAPTQATDPAQGSRRPAPQAMQLPPLGDSDSMLRELAGALSRNPLIARLVATRGTARAITLAVVQIGDGRTPAVPLAVLRPATRLTIAGSDQTTGHVDAASFARWEAATTALLSIPATDAAQAYVNVKPLFDEAYRELGHPEGDFDVALAKAIRMLEATPPNPAELQLHRREGYFEHADPALQAAYPVQKQLILLGSQNRSRVLGWLRQFATALDLKLWP
jgi:hypothetical protein